MNKKTIYCCGPTVYDRVHLGNLRIYVFLDYFIKTLDSDTKVFVNITDIDDKILNSCNSATYLHFIKKYTNYFKKALSFLKCQTFSLQSCMSNIQIIKQTILNLQTKGYTNYNTEKMGLCFYKPNQNDFVLWKNKKDKITWNSKWGYGRPGWHIECASLICKLLQSNNTRELDFHLGGLDLKPIHHKNQELILNSLNYKVKNWIHISELRKDGKKMSKSLGNTLYLQDLKDFSPYVIRYLFLSSNPEDIINFNSELLENKRSELRKISVLIANFLVNSYQDISKLDSQNIGIWNFKSGDYIQEFINYKNITFKQVLRVYCFNKLSNILPSRVFKIPNQVIDLFHKRIKVRQKNNFLESDKIRETIKTWKYNIQDMNNISLLIPLI